MSRDHLHGSQQRVQVAHVGLRPLEALGLLRVDHPHGIQRVVGSLDHRQRAVEEDGQENAFRGYQTSVGATGEQLLDALVLCGLVVGVLLTLSLECLQTLLEVSGESEDDLAALAELFVLPGIFLGECLGEEEDDDDQDDQTDHTGREARKVVAVLQ